MGIEIGNCVVEGTSILTFGKTYKPIEELEVRWDYDLDQADPQLFQSNDGEAEPLWSALGEKVYPLFRVHNRERFNQVTLEVVGRDRDHTLELTTTEFHPIMTNAYNVAPARFLAEGSEVLILGKDHQKEIGVVRSLSMRSDVDRCVYTVALANEDYYEYFRDLEKPNIAKGFDVENTAFGILGTCKQQLPDRLEEAHDASGRFRAALAQDLENFHTLRGNTNQEPLRAEPDDLEEELVNSAMKDLLGVPRSGHVIFANGIGSGSFTLQYKLLQRLKKGISLSLVLA